MAESAGTGGKLGFLAKGVAQIGFVVKDAERTARAFWRLFGIGPWRFYTYGRPLVKRMTRHGKPAEYRMRVALADAGPVRLELVQPLEGDTVYSEFVRRHGYGIQHLGVLVEKMETAVREAAAAGLEVTMDGAGFGLDGDGHYAYLDTEDEIGTVLELIERPKRRAEPEMVYPPEKPGSAS